MIVKVDERRGGRFQRLFPQIPGIRPRQLSIGQAGNLRHPGQSQITALGHEGSIEVRLQLGPACFPSTRMRKAGGEVGPGIHFDQ